MIPPFDRCLQNQFLLLAHPTFDFKVGIHPKYVATIVYKILVALFPQLLSGSTNFQLVPQTIPSALRAGKIFLSFEH